MKNLVKSLVLVSVLSVFASCNKEDKNEHKPEISITSPEEGKMYHGEKVHIKAKLTHKSDDIHEYAVELKKVDSDEVVLKINKHIHAQPVIIDTFWVNTNQGHTDLKLTVSGSDHSHNITTKTVNFSSHIE
ncbi:hypothetical protein RCC89_02525 [Cytophagaceae bacterium ABcell3]|nr:hypothetical protein RCC89_02525 [Cytophagaceae bacterium ABcell3]